jgi:outer membrane protein assembly factor BamB
MITSLKGHRDDLVWFDADGNTARTLESAISGQTGSLALDTTVAVDGLGTVYALSSYDGAVFKFSPEGKFIDRFDYQGSNGQNGQCIAVDGQGRVYIGGSRQVSIFSPDGSFIRNFETEVNVYKMAFSEQGDLYIVSGDSVSRYTLGELP